MEAATLAAGGALAGAAAAGLVLGQWGFEGIVRARRAQAVVGGDGPGAAPWLLRHGARPLLPAARLLLRARGARQMARDACALLAERGAVSSPEAVASLLLLACAALGVVAWLASGTPVCAAAVAACVTVAAAGALRAAQDRRQEALRAGVPDALRSMGVCFRAGLSLPQTLRQTADEVGGPLGALFARAAARLGTGCTPGEALAVFRGQEGLAELAFVAVSLDVQHQSGGSLASVLDAARESVEGELELRRSLRVQTAQAKLSARIVTLMPFLLVALFSLVSEGFLEPFFGSPVGVALLGAALAMQAAGVLAVRHMLDVGVGR